MWHYIKVSFMLLLGLLVVCGVIFGVRETLISFVAIVSWIVLSAGVFLLYRDSKPKELKVQYTGVAYFAMMAVLLELLGFGLANANRTGRLAILWLLLPAPCVLGSWVGLRLQRHRLKKLVTAQYFCP